MNALYPYCLNVKAVKKSHKTFLGTIAPRWHPPSKNLTCPTLPSHAYEAQRHLVAIAARNIPNNGGVEKYQFVNSGACHTFVSIASIQTE